MHRRWFENDHEYWAGRRGRPPRPDRPFGGGGPFGGGPFGGGPFGGGPNGPLQYWLGQVFGRGPRRRRGNVRFAILALLNEQPLNGYQIMQAIEQRSHGTWKPSSGSIYPTLQQLDDEGLVTAAEATAGQSRTFELTKAGRTYVKEHPDELELDWDLDDDTNPWLDNPRFALFGLLKQLGQATVMVAQAGGDKQIEQATRLLTDVRRKLYAILADLGEDE